VVNPLPLAQALIRCPSVTPHNAGVLEVLEAQLVPLGFRCHRLTFGAVDNLYARLGETAPNLCFAGHVDVVPPGDAAGWSLDPFAATVREGRLYGRGASDMKSAIAAFVAAVAQLLVEHGDQLPRGSISLLITGDEEGPALDGTRRVLEWLSAQGERLDACVVGEPTNPATLGKMAKVGRRGSLNAVLTVHGKQGHVAYPEQARNPVPVLLRVLRALAAQPLDAGTDRFQPSNLEITSVDVGNPVTNVIPASATARLNIRFNTLHSGTSLSQWLHGICQGITADYSLDVQVSGEAFLSAPDRLHDCVVAAVQQVTGHTPELSTSGGTSDARFIHHHCPVIEFGGVGATMHQVDENMAVADIEALTRIYQAVLAGYFGETGNGQG
jgi:succinyl-diaminopimelate desuccinylase